MVGGVSEKDFADYAKIGVRTFGLGSSLYTPGMSVEAVAGRALAAVTAWDAVFAGGTMSMTAVSVLSDIVCHLGEGPTYDPQSDKLFWFDIRGKKLLEKRMPGRRGRSSTICPSWRARSASSTRSGS